MKKYDEYIRNQTVVHGQIMKPAKYKIGLRRAIDHFFRVINDMDAMILDVGCGSGYGMDHLEAMGFRNVKGIELHHIKALIANAYWGDAAKYEFKETFDVILSSHSFEHMFDPDAALKNLLEHSAKESRFFFVLPYPDTGPETGHPASERLGLHEHDEGETVIAYFEDRGLVLRDARFDDYREPEIWLDMVRKP